MGKEFKFKVVEKLKKNARVCTAQIRKEMQKLDMVCYDLKSEKEAREFLQARKSKTVLEHHQQRTHKIYAEDEETASILILKRLQKEGFSRDFLLKCSRLNANLENFITTTELIPIK